MELKVKYINKIKLKKLKRMHVKSKKKIISLRAFQAKYIKGYYTLKEQYFLCRFLDIGKELLNFALRRRFLLYKFLEFKYNKNIKKLRIFAKRWFKKKRNFFIKKKLKKNINLRLKFFFRISYDNFLFYLNFLNKTIIIRPFNFFSSLFFYKKQHFKKLYIFRKRGKFKFTKRFKRKLLQRRFSKKRRRLRRLRFLKFKKMFKIKRYKKLKIRKFINFLRFIAFFNICKKINLKSDDNFKIKSMFYLPYKKLYFNKFNSSYHFFFNFNKRRIKLKLADRYSHKLVINKALSLFERKKKKLKKKKLLKKNILNKINFSRTTIIKKKKKFKLMDNFKNNLLLKNDQDYFFNNNIYYNRYNWSSIYYKKLINYNYDHYNNYIFKKNQFLILKKYIIIIEKQLNQLIKNKKKIIFFFKKYKFSFNLIYLSKKNKYLFLLNKLNNLIKKRKKKLKKYISTFYILYFKYKINFVKSLKKKYKFIKKIYKLNINIDKKYNLKKKKNFLLKYLKIFVFRKNYFPQDFINWCQERRPNRYKKANFIKIDKFWKKVKFMKKKKKKQKRLIVKRFKRCFFIPKISVYLNFFYKYRKLQNIFFYKKKYNFLYENHIKNINLLQTSQINKNNLFYKKIK